MNEYELYKILWLFHKSLTIDDRCSGHSGGYKNNENTITQILNSLTSIN